MRSALGTEANDLAILGGVGLKTLKAGLCILQNACTLAHGDGGLFGQRTVVPRAVLVVGNVAPISLHVAEAKARPINILCHNSILLSQKMWINQALR